MNDIIYQGIEEILLIAFDTQWLGTPIATGLTIAHGIPVGVALIVISFVMAGF